MQSRDTHLAPRHAVDEHGIGASAPTQSGAAGYGGQAHAAAKWARCVGGSTASGRRERGWKDSYSACDLSGVWGAEVCQLHVDLDACGMFGGECFVLSNTNVALVPELKRKTCTGAALHPPVFRYWSDTFQSKWQVKAGECQGSGRAHPAESMMQAHGQAVEPAG